MEPKRFNPPPGWPVPPGWSPHPEWRPDPAWPEAPAGWQLWVAPRSGATTAAGPPAEAATWHREPVDEPAPVVFGLRSLPQHHVRVYTAMLVVSLLLGLVSRLVG